MSAATPRSFRNRVRSFATYIDGVRSCAAAIENGRRPSSRAIADAGFAPDAFDFFGRR